MKEEPMKIPMASFANTSLKNRDFRTITHSEIIHAMKRLNNRPRKRLGYKTPNQVFFGESFNVALTT
jgi:Transposase and inactivated derivatives, IS30 family